MPERGSNRALNYSAAFDLEGMGGLGKQVQAILNSQTNPEIQINARDNVTPLLRTIAGSAGKLSPVLVLTAKDLASRQIQTVLKSMQQVSGKGTTVRVDADTRNAQNNLTGISKSLKEIDNTKFDINTSGTLDKLRTVKDTLVEIASAAKNVVVGGYDSLMGKTNDDYNDKKDSFDKAKGYVKAGLVMAGVGAVGAWSVGGAMGRQANQASFQNIIKRTNELPMASDAALSQWRKDQVTATNELIVAEKALKDMRESTKAALVGSTKEERAGLENALTAEELNVSYMQQDIDALAQKISKGSRVRTPIDPKQLEDVITQKFNEFPAVQRSQLYMYAGRYARQGQAPGQIERTLQSQAELAASMPTKSYFEAAEALSDALQGDLMRFQEFNLPNSVREMYQAVKNSTVLWEGETKDAKGMLTPHGMVEAAGITREKLPMNSQGFITDQAKWETLITAQVLAQTGGSTETYAKTAQGQWNNFKSQMTEIGATIGTTVLPQLTRFFAMLNSIAMAVQKIPHFGGIGAIVISLGLLSGVVWGLGAPIIKLILLMKALGASLEIGRRVGLGGPINQATSALGMQPGQDPKLRDIYRGGRAVVRLAGPAISPFLSTGASTLEAVDRGGPFNIIPRAMRLAGRTLPGPNIDFTKPEDLSKVLSGTSGVILRAGSSLAGSITNLKDIPGKIGQWAGATLRKGTLADSEARVDTQTSRNFQMTNAEVDKFRETTKIVSKNLGDLAGNTKASGNFFSNLRRVVSGSGTPIANAGGMVNKLLPGFMTQDLGLQNLKSGLNSLKGELSGTVMGMAKMALAMGVATVGLNAISSTSQMIGDLRKGGIGKNDAYNFAKRNLEATFGDQIMGQLGDALMGPLSVGGIKPDDALKNMQRIQNGLQQKLLTATGDQKASIVEALKSIDANIVAQKKDNKDKYKPEEVTLSPEQELLAGGMDPQVVAELKRGGGDAALQSLVAQSNKENTDSQMASAIQELAKSGMTRSQLGAMYPNQSVIINQIFNTPMETTTTTQSMAPTPM